MDPLAVTLVVSLFVIAVAILVIVTLLLRRFLAGPSQVQPLV